MKIRDTLLLTIGAAMFVLIAVMSVRIAQYFPQARVELARFKLAQLDESTERIIANLNHDVLITYYVSSRQRMPSPMKRMQRDVADVLEAMKQRSNGRLTYQIIDPEDDPQFAEHAAHQRIAPFRVRDVNRDSYDERTVWSSLLISYGSYDPVPINGIAQSHLPRMQTLIAANIQQKDEPQQPVFTVTGGSPFDGLANYLAQFGRVHRMNLNAGEAIPPDTNVLFIMEPTEPAIEIVNRLQSFLAAGGSAVLAGSLQHADVQLDADEPLIEFSPSGFEADAVLSAFGINVRPATVLDESSHLVPFDPQPLAMRFWVRCIGPNQDFRQMRSLPNGNLMFDSPMVMLVDREQTRRLGFDAITLATTSERTALGPMITGSHTVDSLQAMPAEPVTKLPLMVWLRPDEPWRGSLVVCGSSSMFGNDWLTAEQYAHRRLVEVLRETLASDDRMVMQQTGVLQLAPMPELSGSVRTMWRAICIALIPLVTLAIGAFRKWPAIRAERSRPVHHWTSIYKVTLAIASVAITVFVLTAAAMALRARFDLSSSGVNQLSPASRTIAQQSNADTVQATLYFSNRQHMPPYMLPLVRDLRQSLTDFRLAGAALNIASIEPESLDADSRESLRQSGIEPVRLTMQDEEVTQVRTLFCTLALQLGDRRELLHFPDRASFEHLEFRIAFALWRLQTGRQPHIAFASDMPRLSPAEALIDFQQRSLHAPSGTDIYSNARHILERIGFRITTVNTQRPEIPDDVDLIIWMQPRRNIYPMLQSALDHLHRGTPMIIAVQHFNVQARQYRGDEFRMVYWPQPQEPDINRIYLPQLGIDLVREVLLDELKVSLPLETQVNIADAQRDYIPQTSALPFFIRASASLFADHPIMRGVGDQAMPFANFFRLDESTLQSHNLRVTPLITTSDRAWSYRWTGGWIPNEVLDGTVRESETTAPISRATLAMLVEGKFPMHAAPLITRAAEDGSPIEFAASEGIDSQLLLLGCSQMFTNQHISNSDFRADHLLINMAAALALDDDLAQVATHRRLAPGFDVIDADHRMAWRAAVVGAGPVALLLVGAMWLIARSRRSNWPDVAEVIAP